MNKQLSLSMRPKTLDELVGQEVLVKRIRSGVRKSGIPKGWLLCGPKGVGKTSTARILALSVQCQHQDKFGRPCIDCRRERANFPIYSINCGKSRGVETLEQIIESAAYEIGGKGRRKVFILDEAHMLSAHAQNLLLDPTEDGENKSVWIICSTRPDKIIETLRSRLKVRVLRPLNRDNTLLLVTRLLEKLKSELDPELLADALVENSVDSGRLIANAVESYYEGATPEEAANVDSSTDISTKVLCRAVAKGDWEATSNLLKRADPATVRALRSAVIGYLRVVLLESSEIDGRSKAVAESIRRLAYVASAEDVNQMGALVAELFGLCETFQNYSL